EGARRTLARVAATWGADVASGMAVTPSIPQSGGCDKAKSVGSYCQPPQITLKEADVIALWMGTAMDA
ncbi:MAG TPA: hypothetical protein VLT88_07165, partial [Desulfosarcina sp.]|nr:hypothetical protein [Desulfosarcina sp.]